MIAALALLLAAAAPPATVAAPPEAALAALRARPPEDEIIYFVLPDRFANGDPGNDRGGLKGDRLATGYDPTSKGFFHGGDFKGLLAKLDYIQGLGATAIWLTPIFANKPVQGPKGQESAGYHGYWITDFTRPDPHLGSEAELKALVDAVHARGMKFYMDIVINHTADVIQYRECVPAGDCPYRSKADYPYSRRGGLAGPAINPAFKGDPASLLDLGWAYAPYVPAGEEHAKTPDWLNDPHFYHNRGNSAWAGESQYDGDFSGLDDVMTEHPRVVAGFIEIFGDWIDRYGVDGFRIDTAKHVNPEFWQAFVPAMAARARARGIANFHIFAESYEGGVDTGRLAEYTRRDRLPNVLDFSFQAAVRGLLEGKAGPDSFARLVAGDVLYEGGTATATRNPTFLGNHDMGRLAWMLDKAFPQATAAERLARLELANVLLFTTRGVPALYYGDEQGLTGDGGDQDARQDMAATRVASYADDVPVGGAAPAFATTHPLYRNIATLAALRRASPALRHGATVVREAGTAPGLLAFSRVAAGEEMLVLVNSTTAPINVTLAIDPATLRLENVAGACPALAAPGAVRVSLPPLGHALCRALR